MLKCGLSQGGWKLILKIFQFWTRFVIKVKLKYFMQIKLWLPFEVTLFDTHPSPLSIAFHDWTSISSENAFHNLRLSQLHRHSFSFSEDSSRKNSKLIFWSLQSPHQFLFSVISKLQPLRNIKTMPLNMLNNRWVRKLQLNLKKKIPLWRPLTWKFSHLKQ